MSVPLPPRNGGEASVCSPFPAGKGVRGIGCDRSSCLKSGPPSHYGKGPGVRFFARARDSVFLPRPLLYGRGGRRAQPPVGEGSAITSQNLARSLFVSLSPRVIPSPFDSAQGKLRQGIPDISRHYPKHPQPRLNRNACRPTFIPIFVSFRARLHYSPSTSPSPKRSRRSRAPILIFPSPCQGEDRR
jgi:hypothetical protein